VLKVKVTVPAVITGWSAGLDGIALALTLSETLEFGVRADSKLTITVQGEGDRPSTLRHPALRAAVAVFQSQERAPVGLSVTIQSRIPANAGLGDEVALTVGGLIGANNLLDVPLKRDELIDMACKLTGQATAPIAAMLGGMVLGGGHDQPYRRLNSAAIQAVVISPDVVTYADPLPNLAPIPLADVGQNAVRAALTIEAFRTGDWNLLARVLPDTLIEPSRRALIPGADKAIAAAREAGALCTTIGANNPTVITFAQVNHKRIEDAMREAFDAAEVRTRAWVVGIDSQGVTVSVTR